MVAKFSFCISLLIAGLCLLACKKKTENVSTHLGEIKFEVTGKAEAQDVFQKGMLLLHSFEYADAAEALGSKESS